MKEKIFFPLPSQSFKKLYSDNCYVLYKRPIAILILNPADTALGARSVFLPS